MNDEIQKGIDESIAKAMQFSTKKYGDTPTDALQLTPKKYVDGNKGTTVYRGFVNSDGTAGNLPAGWTSAHTGTGQYTVEHDLLTAGYSMVITPIGGYGIGQVNTVGSSIAYVDFIERGGNLLDTAFSFILIKF